MSFILTKNAGVPVKYLIEGYIEQDTDRAQLRTDYTLGSKIKVIETGKTYVLTENGWKYLEESSFDPSVLDDYYTKEETDELIAALNSFVYVDTLPTENIKTNVIYLVPAADPGDDDIKDEYLNLDGTSAGWERIGSTRIDLTQYYTKTETDAKFVEKEAGKGLSTNDYTTTEKQKLAGIASGAEVNVQSDWSEQDNSADGYIKNKPTLGTAAAANVTDFATAAQGVKADNAETKNIEQDGRLDTLEDEIIVTKTISGDFLHITDAANFPAESVVTTLEPVQDLHGYSKPWPAGSGKNLAKPITTFTDNGVTFNVDGQGVITLSGTAISKAVVVITNTIQLFAGQTITFSINNSSILGGLYGYGFGTYTITPAADFGSNGIQIQLEENVNYTGQVLKPQLELGSTATSYEPYSNECPITGHTGVELTRTGKNLLDDEFEIGKIDWATGQNTSDTSCIRSKNYSLIKGGLTYYFSIKNGSTDGGEGNIFWYDADKNFISATYATNVYPSTLTKIAPDNAAYVRVSPYASYGTTYNNDIGINYPATATTYEPYTPEIHSVTFPQAQSPVYGCEVDWANGVLKIKDVKETKVWKDRTSSEELTNVTRGSFALANSTVPIDERNSEKICSLAPYKAAYFENSVHFYVQTENNLQTRAWVFLPTNTDANTEIEICYPLATPIEIPLTPKIITLLKGENNVWLDVGTFEKFEYYPDSTIGEQIGELDKRITDLENQDIEPIIDVTVLPTGSSIKNAIYRLATTVEGVTTYTYYLGDAENETTTEIPDKDYVDDHIPTYWEGTRAEYEALTEPLPDGTYVYLLGESVDYNELDNLPKINNIELAGNKSASDLGLAEVGDSYTKAESDARYILKDSNLTVQNISDFFNLQRTGKVYQVKIPKFASNTTTTCIKTLDNAGLVAEPSTGDVTNRDDYLDIPLFKWYRCNYVRNSAGVPIITAIKGDINYKETGNVDVGSFGMSFYFKQTEDTDYIYWTISDTANETYGLDTPWYGCVDENGNMLPYWCYSAWHGLYSRLGDPCYIFQSYSSMITNYQTKGAGYWGSTIDKNSFAVLMTAMKYGQKSSQNVFKGCVNYSLQYVAADKTLTGVTYFPVTTAQAANILVGSTVIVGYAGNNSGALNTDRGQATMRAYADRVNVLKKVDAGNNIVHIYLDTDKKFNTADVEIATGLDSPVYISTIAWNNGSTEKIAGMHDGSPYSNTSGKEPFRLMGIEYMIGAYDVVGNVAMNINSDLSVDFYYAEKGTTHSTDTSVITSTYTNAGQMIVDDVGANTWIGDVKIADGGVYFATTKGTGDSVGCGDIIWKNTGTGWRECLLLGNLGNGSAAGLCNLNCNLGLANADWNIAASD